MKEYKVIKPFGNALKGDVFKQVEEGDDLYCMERYEDDDCVSKDTEKYIKSWVSMELDDTTVMSLVNEGYLMLIQNEENSSNKLDELKIFIESMISTYQKDYKNLMDSYNEGSVQPCVKVEAETVYYNLMKVLETIKNKINE